MYRVRFGGLMGVPISYMDKHCPEQFEIVGLVADKRDENPAFIKCKPIKLDDKHTSYMGAVLNGKATYSRIVVRRKVCSE